MLYWYSIGAVLDSTEYLKSNVHVEVRWPRKKPHKINANSKYNKPVALAA